MIVNYLVGIWLYYIIIMDTIKLNIVDLIERNPITKLSKNYNIKIIDKNEGQYGIGLKSDNIYDHKLTSNTGKKVEKLLKSSCLPDSPDPEVDIVINTWETITKAAESEKMSASKMSQSIKNK